MGSESVSDSKSNVSVLNQGNEPVIRSRFCFVLKPGCETLVSTIGMGMGSHFVFHFLRRDLAEDGLSSIYYSCGL